MPIVMNKITIGHASSDPVGDGLRADAIFYYTLNESSGTRADSTGRGNDLAETSSSVSSVAGKIGNAAHFVNGDQKWLARASNTDLQITGSASFSFWLRADVSAYYVVFGKWNFGGGNMEYLMECNLGNITFYVRNADDSGYSSVALSSNPISGNTWYYLAAYHDAVHNEIGIAANGGSFSASSSAGARTSNAIFDLGSNTAAPFATLSGDVDEFGKWNRLLTLTEIAYLYNSGAGRGLY
jgi:hypothetical protein